MAVTRERDVARPGEPARLLRHDEIVVRRVDGRHAAGGPALGLARTKLAQERALAVHLARVEAGGEAREERAPMGACDGDELRDARRAVAAEIAARGEAAHAVADEHHA